ncbi:MAG: cupin domain-containing protein [Bacilli bacterium]
MNNKKLKQIINHFDLKKLPIENTFFKQTYYSSFKDNNNHYSSAMIGLFSKELDSYSCFHQLNCDETWHFYDGDPIILYLLHLDGTYQEVILGLDYLNNQHPQFTIKANTWQAASLYQEGNYALYGCSVTPAFTPDCFKAIKALDLIALYPKHHELIMKFNHDVTTIKLPEDI